MVSRMSPTWRGRLLATGMDRSCFPLGRGLGNRQRDGLTARCRFLYGAKDSRIGQTVLQTDYMHGRLTPRAIIITDVTGVFGFAPSVTYRFKDYLLGSVQYLAIAASRRAGLGTFRGHDMVQLRLTYQLN